MQIKIYQINKNRDLNKLKFSPLFKLSGSGETAKIDASIYDEVFSGNVDCANLEAVFQKFNTGGHPLHRGHMLSVSDIVEIKGEEIPDNNGTFYCDKKGFKRVEFDVSKSQKPNNLMKIIYVEPRRLPFVSEIEHTLEAEQRAVGGLIEPVYNHEDDTCIICNEEGKLIGLEGNRRIGDGSSIIAGPFFICGLTNDGFRGLTDEEVVKYMERFREPEEISREETQADMGFNFIPM